jgi:DNA repair exonuclease SbcCD nuclease subunit
MTRFIHIADWQLGKPFDGISDTIKHILLKQERLKELMIWKKKPVVLPGAVI